MQKIKNKKRRMAHLEGIDRFYRRGHIVVIDVLSVLLLIPHCLDYRSIVSLEVE